jgi:hypothetical protein
LITKAFGYFVTETNQTNIDDMTPFYQLDDIGNDRTTITYLARVCLRRQTEFGKNPDFSV